MKINLYQAKQEDREIIKNLSRFYIYDMSRYCNWETPSNGFYESCNVDRYWEEDHRYPFLIKINRELAGFVLINKIGTTTDVDWNMGEFFIVSKFQRKGVGSKIAKQIFLKFTGIWEIPQIPENIGAIIFWEKLFRKYLSVKFQKTQKIILEPTPHPMLILRFHSISLKSPMHKIISLL